MQIKKIFFGLQYCRMGLFMVRKEKIYFKIGLQLFFYMYIVIKNIQLGMYIVNRNVFYFYILFYRIFNKMIIFNLRNVF